MKLSKGQKAKVVAEICGHGFKIDEIITIKKVNDHDYLAEGVVGHTWYVIEDEVELYTEVI